MKQYQRCKCVLRSLPYYLSVVVVSNALLNYQLQMEILYVQWCCLWTECERTLLLYELWRLWRIQTTVFDSRNFRFVFMKAIARINSTTLFRTSSGGSLTQHVVRHALKCMMWHSFARILVRMNHAGWCTAISFVIITKTSSPWIIPWQCTNWSRDASDRQQCVLDHCAVYDRVQFRKLQGVLWTYHPDI